MPIDSSNDWQKKLCRLRRMAANGDWHVRETAGFCLRDLLECEFEPAFAATRSWVDDRDERVRRAACLGCMQRKKFGTPLRIAKLLQRMAILIRDPSCYVRKCCGPYVLGYLGYTYPDLVLPWIKKKSRSRNAMSRWNVAMAFSQALGKRHPLVGITILTHLSRDKRPVVRRAVRTGARTIATKCEVPSIVSKANRVIAEIAR